MPPKTGGSTGLGKNARGPALTAWASHREVAWGWFWVESLLRAWRKGRVASRHNAETYPILEQPAPNLTYRFASS